MKANRGSGGIVQDVTYENLTMTNVKIPILITSYYPTVPKQPELDKAQAVTPTTPIWRHIRIHNVNATGAIECGRIFGLPEMPVLDIELRDVHITGDLPMRIVHARGINFAASRVTSREGRPIIVLDGRVTGINTDTGNPIQPFDLLD